MKRPRRNHTAACKAKVALAALKGDKALAELSEEFDVHSSQIVHWKTQLLEGAMGVFLTPAAKREAVGTSVKDMHLERSLAEYAAFQRSAILRWCWCGESCSAVARYRKAAPRPSAGSPGHRYPPARCGRSHAPRNRNSDSSRRRWRTSPWISPSAARPFGHRPCAAPAPSCCIECRPRSSHPIAAGWRER